MKFARWQHPALGRGAECAVPVTTYYHCFLPNSTQIVWSQWKRGHRVTVILFETSSRAIARDASCLLVASNSTIRRAQDPLQIYGCVQLHSILFSASCWTMLVVIGVNFYKAARIEPPPTFQPPRLSGFWAPPHFFVTCNAYYEVVFCGLPNNKMTPNDIHANQTTSFVRIQQWKL